MSGGSAATPATTRRGGALFRSATAAGFFQLTFDADNREDQNLAHRLPGQVLFGDVLFGRSPARTAIDVQGRPPRSRIRRKFKDGTHINIFSLIAALTVVCRRRSSLRTGRG